MSRLDNLGDYNFVRDDLYNCGGDRAKLYQRIGDAAVAEKAPALLIIGGVIALAADFSTRAIINKGAKFMKKRKKILDGKPSLERQLAEQIEKASALTEDFLEETDSDEVN